MEGEGLGYGASARLGVCGECVAYRITALNARIWDHGLKPLFVLGLGFIGGIGSRNGAQCS